MFFIKAGTKNFSIYWDLEYLVGSHPWCRSYFQAFVIISANGGFKNSSSVHKWDLTGTATFLAIFLFQLLIFFYRIKILNNCLSLNLFPQFFFSHYSMEPAIVVCLVIAFIFWLIRLARIVVHFFKLMEIRAFYKNALRITEVITGISSVILIIMIIFFFLHKVVSWECWLLPLMYEGTLKNYSWFFPSGLKLYFRAEMKLIGHPFMISSLKSCWQIYFAFGCKENLSFSTKLDYCRALIKVLSRWSLKESSQSFIPQILLL